MAKKPYKAKSLTGAQARVRQLERIVEDYRKLVDRFDDERRLLAQLAAEGPAFFSPLEAMAAKQIRDGILGRLGMNPDGSFKTATKVQS